MDPYNQPSSPQPTPEPQPAVTPEPAYTPAAPTPPPYQPVAPQGPGVPTQPTGQDPGKGLAIAGIVLAFFISLVGLILSIIAKKKSKAAGFHNTLATVGIVLNAVFLTISVIAIPILIAITMMAYTGIQQRATSSSGEATARLAIKKTEAYYAIHNAYPKTVTELNSDTESTLLFSDINLSSTPLTSSTAYVSDQDTTKTFIELYECGSDGNKAGYWDNTMNMSMYLYSGSASDSSSCTLIY